MRIPDNRDLLAACLWAGAATAAVAASDDVFLRTILGAPMVLLVPGHVLLRAMGIKTTSVAEHLAWAVGASLAAGIAGGFALNAAGFLVPLGWALWCLAVTAAAALVAVRRRDTPDLPVWPGPMRIRLWPGVTIALAMLVAIGAYALAIRNDAADKQFKYTELWMLPPTEGGAARLLVGVRNDETQTRQFDLDVTLDGRPLAVFRSLTVAPGDTFAQEIPVPILATQQKAEARLYRPEINLLYRSVSTLVPRT